MRPSWMTQIRSARADGAQAVGDDDGGAPLQQGVQRLLDQGLGEAVHVGGGFVQDEDARVGEQGAGDADQLALPDGQVGGALLHPGLVAIRLGRR